MVSITEDFRTLGALYEDYPLIATFPHQTGQSRTNRPDKALGGLWESSGHAGGNTLSGSPSPVGVPAGCRGPDGLTGPASPKCGPIEAEVTTRPVLWPPQKRRCSPDISPPQPIMANQPTRAGGAHSQRTTGGLTPWHALRPITGGHTP